MKPEADYISLEAEDIITNDYDDEEFFGVNGEMSALERPTGW